MSDIIQAVNSASRQSDATNRIIDFIVATAKANGGKTISRDAAKAIYRGLFEKIFSEAKANGTFKLPWGLGQFYVVVIGMNAQDRKMPGGRVVKRNPKPTIRYTAGESVKAILGIKSVPRSRNSDAASVE